MMRRRTFIGAAVLLPVMLFAGVYFVFFTPESPEPLGLDRSPASAGAVDADDLPGRWEVTDGSAAGYRVREKLARLPAQSDAVGRTTEVTGGVVIEKTDGGFRVADMSFEADMTALRSDEQRRDNRIRTTGIETDTYRTSVFESSEPVDVPASALDEQTFETNVKGKLTLHGVTKDVELPVKVRLVGSSIEIAGSVPIEMADYEITPPSIGGFVTVEPRGTMEFLVLLTKNRR